MSEILDITEKYLSDDNIIKKDYHSYIPYIQSYKNNDEIRFTIQNQDLYILPCESYIHLECHISLPGGGALSNDVKFRNNCVAHMFDEIRYEINGIEIDRTRYLGISTTIKNYVSLNEFESNILQNAGWNKGEDISTQSLDFYIPLKMLMGFAEDFNKIILNSKHELIILRSSNDGKVCYSTKDNEIVSLNITNMTWRIPHVQLSDLTKIKIMKTIKDGTALPIAFRSWDCYFNPILRGGIKNNWNVKMSINRERPRIILFVFEKNNKFIHANLRNMKVHLNSISYPYDDLNLKIDDNRYAILYEMYTKFQQNYYQREPQPLLSRQNFKDTPIITIDVSHQNEMVKGGPIDVKIEFETSIPIGENVTAYCLILHDRLVEYTPLTGIVRRII